MSKEFTAAFSLSDESGLNSFHPNCFISGSEAARLDQPRPAPMSYPQFPRAALRFPCPLLAIFLAISLALSACRRPRSNQPRAPEIHQPVTDLAAIRGADGLWLTWTMPKKDVRKLLVDGRIKVTVCRREGLSGQCNLAGSTLQLAPGAIGSFAETLPGALATGNPRALYYFVQLLDRNGASTGFSNSVVTLAGSAPAAPDGLTAEVTGKGVLLRWAPVSATDDLPDTAIRIHRTQIVLASSQSDADSALPPTPEENLLIDNGSQRGQALDTDVHRGETYQYTIQRVVRIKDGGQVLELAGQFSAPAEVKIPNNTFH